MEKNAKSIVEMARGAILERINYEMARVMDNILDANTKPTAKRKLTVTLTFTPDDERATIAVNVVAKTTLAPTNPVVTSLYIAGEDGTGEGSGGRDGPTNPRSDQFGRRGAGGPGCPENH